MDKTTSTEFLEWIHYMDVQETRGFSRMDYYMAQIACEVFKGLRAKDARRVKVEDFLLEFTNKPKATPASIERSKAFWFAAAGGRKGS